MGKGESRGYSPRVVVLPRGWAARRLPTVTDDGEGVVTRAWEWESLSKGGFPLGDEGGREKRDLDGEAGRREAVDSWQGGGTREEKSGWTRRLS